MSANIVTRKRRWTAVVRGVLSSLLVVCGLASCVFGGTVAPSTVLLATESVKAKYVVIDQKNEGVVAKGLTPDQVILKSNGKYRVEITHPDTGKVYSVEVKGQYNLAKGWKLNLREVKAPF